MDPRSSAARGTSMSHLPSAENYKAPSRHCKVRARDASKYRATTRETARMLAEIGNRSGRSATFSRAPVRTFGHAKPTSTSRIRTPLKTRIFGRIYGRLPVLSPRRERTRGPRSSQI